MILLGNDVVDLAAPHILRKVEDERYVRKILTPSERRVLRATNQPDRDLWQFWAAKEAVFKALSRHHPEISSVPGRYSVTWDKASSPSVRKGTVKTPIGLFPVICRSGRNTVMSLCVVSSGPVYLKIGVEKIPHDVYVNDGRTTHVQSEHVRTLAARSLALDLNRPIKEISISAPGKGAPTVGLSGSPADITLSLSHDGPFVYFAYGL